MAKKTSSRFLKVKCSDCEHEQVVYGCAATPVACEVCNKTIVKPAAGKATVTTHILAVLDKDL